MPSSLRFLTSADGSSTPSERMSITSAGVINIATAPPANNPNTSCPVLLWDLAEGDIIQDSIIYTPASDVLTINTGLVLSSRNIRSDSADFTLGTAAQGTVVTMSNSTGVVSGDFNDTSDVALKENITDITGGLSIIKQLQPRNFDWKESGKVTGAAGFIAQEVETILPKEVQGEDYSEGTIDENGVKTGNISGKGINVTGIVAHLTKAVQELEARLAILESE